jgi:hypothetical protein
LPTICEVFSKAIAVPGVSRRFAPADGRSQFIGMALNAFTCQ